MAVWAIQLQGSRSCLALLGSGSYPGPRQLNNSWNIQEEQSFTIKEREKTRVNDSVEQWRRRWKARTVHPNLVIEYFHTIDAKKKAYWLGFMFADGYITRERNGSMLVRLELSLKDLDVINKFCEDLRLEKSKREYQRHGNTESVGIRFKCRAMSDDLLKQGLMFRKSARIEYPKLPRRDLELAFLLGYYDGDGRQKSTSITCGNKRFLEGIKSRFSLPYNIVEDSREKEIDGRKIRGTVYWMSLGAELFNEMMKNYQQSMPRKRWHPCDSKEKARRAAEANTSQKIRERKGMQYKWRAITKEELNALVQELPLAVIATKYNVHVNSVVKKCEKFCIIRPRGRGYWQKRRSSEKNAKRNE
jgi:hypothetical protein